MAWENAVTLGGSTGHHRPSIVVWLDPGTVTGWAWWDTYAESFRSGESEFIPLGSRLASWLNDADRLGHDVWLGWEAFTIRPGSGRMKQDGSSLQVIGVARWLAWCHGAVIVKPQNPDGRTLGLKNLKRVGWHSPGQDHANDAAAHLLSFLLRYHVLPPSLQDLLAPSP
jgi:hypothetical protein